MSTPKSVYVIECEICRNVVRSHAPEAKCDKCGAILVVENWGKPAAAHKASAA